MKCLKVAFSERGNRSKYSTLKLNTCSATGTSPLTHNLKCWCFFLFPLFLQSILSTFQAHVSRHHNSPGDFYLSLRRYKVGSSQESFLCCLLNARQEVSISCQEKAVHNSALLKPLPLLLQMTKKFQEGNWLRREIRPAPNWTEIPCSSHKSHHIAISGH